ncbi:hypothetical protein VE03_10498 [Pseudogymnoascus sp. 23342-1-I1]|nr:hypothetical protein VE03_10498 [Pseudogymnoascus sp. 23342-1-I1]
MDLASDDNTSSHAGNDQGVFPFLSLPREIRDMIYGYLLLLDKPIGLELGSGPENSDSFITRLGLCPHICRTSSQVAFETSKKLTPKNKAKLLRLKANVPKCVAIEFCGATKIIRDELTAAWSECIPESLEDDEDIKPSALYFGPTWLQKQIAIVQGNLDARQGRDRVCQPAYMQPPAKQHESETTSEKGPVASRTPIMLPPHLDDDCIDTPTTPWREMAGSDHIHSTTGAKRNFKEYLSG